MDRALKGHPYVKTGIDMACWDLFGKVCRPVGLRACSAGASGTSFPSLSRHLPGHARAEWPASVAGYRAEGYRQVPAQGGRRPRLDDIARIKAVRAEVLEPDRPAWSPTRTRGG